MATHSDLQKINGKFKGKDILSLDQFSPSDLERLFAVMKKMKTIATHAKPSRLLEGNIVTLLFYEPSSRTFGSFDASVKQLGGQTLDIREPQRFSSVVKGETLHDTIRVFEAYSDLIVIRHFEKGQALKAAQAASFVPVLNAGDGIGEHPTQALLDMATIYEKKGHLDKLTGVMAGDLLNGRTIHSLIRGLSMYKGTTVYLLSPEALRLSKTDMHAFADRGIKLVEIDKENDIPKNADFWYWTRVQKERFASLAEYNKVNNTCMLTKKLVDARAGKETLFMHPLPRVGEIEEIIDADPRAAYLGSEIRNGMYIRMALLALVLGKI